MSQCHAKFDPWIKLSSLWNNLETGSCVSPSRLGTELVASKIRFIWTLPWLFFLNQAVILMASLLSVLIGWGESLLWCAWSRRKLPCRSSFGDDRAERDRVRRRLSNNNLWWFELTLPHPLWPKTQCFSVSRACLHYCRAVKKKEAPFTIVLGLCWSRKLSPFLECYAYRWSKQMVGAFMCLQNIRVGMIEKYCAFSYSCRLRKCGSTTLVTTE